MAAEGKIVCWGGRDTVDWLRGQVEDTYQECTLIGSGEAVCRDEGGNEETIRDGRPYEESFGVPPRTRPFVAVSSGRTGTNVGVCGLTAQGQAVCWGIYGDQPEGAYTAIAGGSTHTCALTTQGRAVCWGWNDEGQLDAPDGAYTAIAAGQYHTCAITAQGEAVCWGNNGAGQGDPYTGIAYDSSTCEVDHVVAAQEAFESGAWAWDTARWRAFGNDAANLVAARDCVNRAKAPATWPNGPGASPAEHAKAPRPPLRAAVFWPPRPSRSKPPGR